MAKKVSKQSTLPNVEVSKPKVAKAAKAKVAKAVSIKDLKGVEASPEYLEAVQGEVRAFQKLVTKFEGIIDPNTEFTAYTRREKIFAVKTHMRSILLNYLEGENLAYIAKHK